MSNLNITGKAYNISQIFSDEFDFEIPHYQRPYAWTTEESDELLDDLSESLGEGDQINIEHAPDYFLGSLVVIKKESDSSAIVVDGQQRLITLTIILSVLRNYLPEDKENNLTRFLYDEGNPLMGTKNRFRLLPRMSDRTFFEQNIQQEAKQETLAKIEPANITDSQNNFVTNALSYHRTLEEWSEERCESLASYILRKCKVVIVSSEDQDSAYRIFSVLNDRGLDLSHADILKADLVGSVIKAKQDAYAIKWEDIENQLGRKRFDDVFAHIRMIYRKSKLQGTVLKEFRDYVVKSHQPDKLIDEVLIPYAQKYDQIKTSSFEFSTNEDEINTIVKALNRIDNVDWIPAALFYLMKNPGKPEDILNFLSGLERLAASMMIMRLNINNRVRRYGNLLKEIEKSDNLDEPTSAMQITTDEKALIIQNLNGNLYDQQAYRLYVLLRLDEKLASSGAIYDHKVITIEHVLPQNPEPKSDWLKSFPNDEERLNLLNCIGNLVLLSRRKNSSAQNYEFEKKKTAYFTKDGVSPFAITTQVIGENQWTPAVIKRRQKNLIDTISILWRLE